MSLARWLEDALSGRSLTCSQLASRLGLNVSTVSRWLAGASRPSPGSLRALNDAFDEDIAILYRLAGYQGDDSHPLQLSEEELLLLSYFRKLTPDQKRIVLAGARVGLERS